MGIPAALWVCLAWGPAWEPSPLEWLFEAAFHSLIQLSGPIVLLRVFEPGLKAHPKSISRPNAFASCQVYL